MKCHIGVRCPNKATAFGPFCGGMCDDHAKAAMKAGDMKITDFWPQHHERLQEKKA